MSQVHIIVISTGKYLKIFVSVFFFCVRISKTDLSLLVTDSTTIK